MIDVGIKDARVLRPPSSHSRFIFVIGFLSKDMIQIHTRTRRTITNREYDASRCQIVPCITSHECSFRSNGPRRRTMDTAIHEPGLTPNHELQSEITSIQTRHR